MHRLGLGILGLLLAGLLGSGTAHAQTPSLYANPGTCILVCAQDPGSVSLSPYLLVPYVASVPVYWPIFPAMPQCESQVITSLTIGYGVCGESTSVNPVGSTAGSSGSNGGGGGGGGSCVSFEGGPCITLCRDGEWSSSPRGPGVCSFHGGIA